MDRMGEKVLNKFSSFLVFFVMQQILTGTYAFKSIRGSHERSMPSSSSTSFKYLKL
jgi:hypothetical protein